ncbi:MAG: hypothetical protein RI513_02245 [Balneolaceae bacterium]|nr:hypothetical protein [Balneolaceae bacterium]MDR9446930.1 hypothetical protein [Balneolaceae bacterium]
MQQEYSNPIFEKMVQIIDVTLKERFEHGFGAGQGDQTKNPSKKRALTKVDAAQKSLFERIESTTWQNPSINASGLDVKIPLNDPNVKACHIHFDWDSFRERCMAKQMKGMEDHPLLTQPHLASNAVKPQLDIEVSWVFQSPYTQADPARAWIASMNESLKPLFLSLTALSRWHLEIEGETEQSSVTDTRLLTYVEFDMEGVTSINHLQRTIERRLVQLVFLTRKVMGAAQQNVAA